MPIFRVKSVKIYTGQKKFTRAPLVVLVTNIRYASETLSYIVYLRIYGLVVNPRGWRMNDEVPLQRKAFSTGIQEKPGH